MISDMTFFDFGDVSLWKAIELLVSSKFYNVSTSTLLWLEKTPSSIICCSAPTSSASPRASLSSSEVLSNSLKRLEWMPAVREVSPFRMMPMDCRIYVVSSLSAKNSS